MTTDIHRDWRGPLVKTRLPLIPRVVRWVETRLRKIWRMR